MNWLRHSVQSRFAGVLWLAIAFVGPCSREQVFAAESLPDKPPAPKPKIRFAPEAEEKIKDFLSKAKEAKRRDWVVRMREEIGRIVKVTGLAADGKTALETAAPQAADACMGPWADKLEDVFRQQLGQQPEQLTEMLDQMITQIDAYVKADWFGDYARPDEQTVWSDALRQTLTPDQSAAWARAADERKNAILLGCADYFKTEAERMRDQQRTGMTAMTSEIKLTLSLPKEIAEKLDALANEAIGKSLEDWRRRTEKILLSMEDVQRKEVIKGRNYFFGIDEKSLPANQTVWKEGLARLLSADEGKRLLSAREEHKSRRVRALGQMLLALLDEKVAFTASEREQLQPIAERLVKDQTALFPQNGGGFGFSNLSQPQFFAAGSKATDEVKVILDPVQWKHWQETCGTLNGNDQGAGESIPATDANTLPGRSEPDDLENAISDFLYKKTEKERKQLLGANLLKAEDAGRTAGLTAEKMDRLFAAARGVTEESLGSWKTSTDQMVRSQITGATADNVKQRLTSLQEYYFNRGGRGSGNQAVWDKTVRTELTSGQQTAWKKEVDARAVYRDSAIVSMLMAEFDRQNLLTADQTQKLTPLIAGVMKEYGQEMSQMFSSSNSGHWFLQGYSMLLPFAGVPEKDLKSILGEEQWDRWTKSDECSNVLQYWSNIQSNHENAKRRQ